MTFKNGDFSDATISGGYFEAIMSGAITLGVPEERLKNIVKQHHPRAIPQERYSAICYLELLQTAADYLKNDSVGILLGSTLRPTRPIEVLYAITLCDNLRDGLRLNLKYQPLIQQLGRTVLTIDSGVARFRFDFAGEHPARQLALQAIFAGYASIGRWLLWAGEAPQMKARFVHAKPKDLTPYHQLFGEDLSFGAEYNELSFSADLLPTPLPGTNPEQLKILKAKLDKDLAELISGSDFVSTVREKIQNLIYESKPNLHSLCRLMKMNERTLRRKLKEHDTSYRELLADIRRDWSVELLGKAELSLTEVALTLGFDDQSAFSRAFKSWYGQSPAVFRQSL